MVESSDEFENGCTLMHWQIREVARGPTFPF